MGTDPSQGRIVGGILDPSLERTYYPLVSCPRRGEDVTLAEHRSCKNFGGLYEDPETGVFFLYCRHLEP